MKLLRQGKVRDIYQVDENQLFIVASDRLSAYDSVFPDPFPGKGAVLTGISKWWMERLDDIITTHWQGGESQLVEGLSDEAKSAFPADHLPDLAKRGMLVEKCTVIPYECIVRGYAFGSYLKAHPDVKPMTRFESPLFTPTTKEESGHDQKVEFSEMEKDLGEELAGELKAKSLALFQKAHDICWEAGLVLVDTKFEFGKDQDGNLKLIDECFTPDSSRFILLDDFNAGRYDSYDKQLVRNHVDELGWDHNPPAPNLAAEIIEQTMVRYRTIEKMVTGAAGGFTRYQVTVEMQPGVLDPEMSTLHRHLQRGGQKGIGQIEKKTIYQIEVSEGGEQVIRQLAEDILANPEVHKFQIEQL